MPKCLYLKSIIFSGHVVLFLSDRHTYLGKLWSVLTALLPMVKLTQFFEGEVLETVATVNCGEFDGAAWKSAKSSSVSCGSVCTGSTAGDPVVTVVCTGWGMCVWLG